MLMPSAFYTYLNTIINILQLLPKREIKLHSLEMVTNNDSDLQSLEIYQKNLTIVSLKKSINPHSHPISTDQSLSTHT